MSALPFLPDACVQWLRDRVRARRFDRELAHRMSRLDNARANLAAALDAVLLQIIQRPAMTNLRKGAPDTTSVLKDKAEQARSLLGNIHMEDTPGALLALTRWMASADARDADCFHAYGLAFCLVQIGRAHV